ncbi:MAG: hypothetical protein WCI49_15945, partial [Ferruginibacter sp.]
MKSLKQIFNFINHHPLAGKHKIKAYYRFFYWQLAQLLFPKERVVKFIGNTKLVVKKGLAGATGNIYAGLHDFADMGFLLHFLRKDDLFFDIGANIGNWAKSNMLHYDKIIAIEASESAYKKLKETIST